MVRNYVKKTNRASINENDVAAAINDILNGNCSLRGAAAEYGIHFATLQYRLGLHRKKNQQLLIEDDSDQEDLPPAQPLPPAVPEVRKMSKYSTQQVFSIDQEAMLVEYLITCSKLKHGLTKADLRKFAFQYAISLRLNVPRSWTKNESAGKDWEQGFMKRHRQLTLRKPENTSLARLTSFNRTNVNEFFENYKKVMTKHNFPPSRIINIDESGVTTVLQAPKVIAETGAKQVGQTVSAERGQLVTFEGIITAEGKALPPAFVFPRKNFKEQFTAGGPEGCLGLANPSGWMNSDNFFEVVKHIQALTLSSNESPVLLLLDNHESHVSLETVEFSRANGMVILTFPPHCSHRMQPLDVGVYGPFKAKCKVAFNEWIQKNPGKTISIYTIPHLVKRAFEEAFSKANIVSAFKKTGLWPINESVFTAEDFLPSNVTDRDLPRTSQSNPNLTGTSTSNPNLLGTSPSTFNAKLSGTSAPNPISPERSASTANSPRTTTSNSNLPQTLPGDSQNNPISSPCSSRTNSDTGRPIVITPESVRPYPKAAPRVSKDNKSKGREKGKTRILTDTPEKDRLVLIEKEKAEKEKKKEEKEERKRKKLFEFDQSHTRPKPKKLKSRTQKNVVLDASTSEEEQSISSGESNLDLDLSEEELEELISNVNSSTLGLNDFVLVKFLGKKTVKYFIGQIEEKIGNTEFGINFMRTKDKKKFIFPAIKDSSYVFIEDIYTKLPSPTMIGGTERAIGGFTFKIDLSSFNMG